MLTNIKYTAMYRRGDIVFDSTDRDSKGEPTYKKLWVWESKYYPSYPTKSGHGHDDAMLYTLKNGPGEKANVVGWAREEDLDRHFPVEEVSLIDL